MQNYTPRLFLIVGSPASGKDELIAAVNTIGSLHAEIVPKHTNRKWRTGDDNEMICGEIPDKQNRLIKNSKYDLDHCDIVYENYGDKYGIKTTGIWDKLRHGIIQVLVVSNKEALNQLKGKFGDLAVVVYVYSKVTREEYLQREKTKQEQKKEGEAKYQIDEEYLKIRAENFDMSWKIYVDNFMLFDHVLIYAGNQEDLFDQIFRLFKAYEKGWIG
jgi:ribose 1,5-bisphosphokinase PhnN